MIVAQANIVMLNSCLIVCPKERKHWSGSLVSVFAVGYERKHLVPSKDPTILLQGQLCRAKLPSPLFSSNLTPQFSVVSLSSKMVMSWITFALMENKPVFSECDYPPCSVSGISFNQILMQNNWCHHSVCSNDLVCSSIMPFRLYRSTV